MMAEINVGKTQGVTNIPVSTPLSTSAGLLEACDIEKNVMGKFQA
jgi:hypothetical protein